MLNANVEITHNRLVTLENRTSMMAKAIMPALKDLKLQINKTNERLASQYRMMSSAHKRYNCGMYIPLCAHFGLMEQI